MNVDIFPNADITYDPPPRPPPFIITPRRPFAMMYGDTRSPLRVEEWKTPDATLFMALPEQDVFDNDIRVYVYPEF